MSAGRRLARALQASAALAGCSVRVSATGERPWSSATFVGAHHKMLVTGEPAETLAIWLEGLPAAALTIPGHVLAELTVKRAGSGASLNALVLEDGSVAQEQDQLSPNPLRIFMRSEPGIQRAAKASRLAVGPT